jgi:hypothetical protein
VINWLGLSQGLGIKSNDFLADVAPTLSRWKVIVFPFLSSEFFGDFFPEVNVSPKVKFTKQ